MKIAIDVDGVLLKTYDLFLNKFNTYYGTSFKHEDLKNYHLWESLGCNKDEVEQTFRDLALEDWTSIKPYVMASCYLTFMNKIDHVDVLTDRKYIPNSLEKVINCLRKNNIKKGEQYNEAIDSNGTSKSRYHYDVFVDDNPYLSTELKHDQFMILFSQPWN